MLRIAGITKESVVDGPGVRFTIFGQGCKHNCSQCHNPKTHDLKGGKRIEIADLVEQILEKELITGLTFSGGEPFLQADGFAKLGAKIKELRPDFDILTYTGFSYEDLISKQNYLALLKISDIIIDGRFKVDKADINLKYRGSSNQRIIDVGASLEADKIITTNI